MTPKRDLYQDVTDNLIRQIEAGASGDEWVMPWSGTRHGLPVNAVTGAAYRGVNIINLWVGATERGYATNAWASYKQWAEKGAQVRKGEKGALVVYYGTTTTRDPSENGDEATREIRFLKHSHVFNAAQVEGYQAPAIERPALASRIEAAEAFVSNTGARIAYGHTRAAYAPSVDQIIMPDAERFKATAASTATENFYSTLLHELTHWTGHEKRCAREFGKRFGDQAYAAEELVAELGAAFLCAQLGIAAEPRADHAHYLAHWLQLLKSDKKAIFTAASKASAAVDYLASCTAQPDAIAA